MSSPESAHSLRLRLNRLTKAACEDASPSLKELADLPVDCAGYPEFWRRRLVSDCSEGELLADLYQEIKLLLFRRDETQREIDQAEAHRAHCPGDETCDLDPRLRWAGGNCDASIADMKLRLLGALNQVFAITEEVACIYFARVYPDAPSLHSIDRQGLSCSQWAAMTFMETIGGRFSDKGFLEDGAIHCAADDSIGLPGMADLITALRDDSVRGCESPCAKITEQDKVKSPDCYNRLRPVRKVDGSVVIVVDQVGNPDYRPPYIATFATHQYARRRFGSRARSSRRGRVVRRRRRATSRSAGGGSSGSDDGPGGAGPHIRTGRPASGHRPLIPTGGGRSHG